MTSKKLWEPKPENAASSNMAAFLKHVDVKRGLGLKDYDDLYSWSVTEIAQLWEDLWEFFGVISSQPFTSVIDDPNKMPGAKWFEGARLNFAENLLRFRDDRTALVFKGEGRSSTKMTYAQLYDEVARVAKSLRDMGVVAGDRIAGFMPNMPHSIIGMLAASSIGAIWSSSSPDFGKRGVLDRFGQIKPRVLFCANGYSFKGKKLNSLASVADFLEQLDSVEKVVVVSYTEDEPDISGVRNAVHYADFRSAEDHLEIHFEQLPFDHPLYIMYSSGTTGLPKCLVQSAGGILLHHLKELVLHTNLRREDNIFYFTTCGWMMWTWLVSSLAVGATVVLYDGNPFYPDASALWNMADEEDLTVFGTSAGYLAALENDGYKPREQNKLQNLRAILSTGSPLSVEGFEFVYRDIKNDVQLASICGGTDLNGCFALGNPDVAGACGRVAVPRSRHEGARFRRKCGAGSQRAGRAGLRRSVPVDAHLLLGRRGRSEISQRVLRCVSGDLAPRGFYRDQRSRRGNSFTGDPTRPSTPEACASARRRSIDWWSSWTRWKTAWSSGRTGTTTFGWSCS